MPMVRHAVPLASRGGTTCPPKMTLVCFQLDVWQAICPWASIMASADQYTLETPENIEVHYDLAGLGTRFCAMLLDGLLLGLVVLVLGILMIILNISIGPAMFSERLGLGRWITAAIVAVVVSLITGGYFILFELLMTGQTPGKRAMKIRVICEDGTPVTGTEVLVRNLVRLVDFLPVGYGVGVIVMFISPLSKRLGDIAAGTIVVKEGQLDYSAQADKKRQLRPTAGHAANSELTPAERQLLTGFLHRRIELLPKARDELAERLARPLYEKYGGNYYDAERYIERLVEGRHHES